ncbi:MAG: bifunctional diaminohydroxyphosphoribosylaminopyrimidine deaminase/5-amino-6-(5-phosphoribosylamino)uracil reductase RibD [Planctomycetes bacterium]|nr:bifunctional diaminohydroxyphosphoribosylaminopyrimidine deaminase/5-amino-6-(5-phosphoribosylamino)uracil reductase RibD [Planctomycetota bacterium]
MEPSNLDVWHMRRALELAERGRGHVEPNPMVGCVIAQGAEIIGQGWHRKFGGPHAEIEALQIAGASDTGARAAGATMYVTLEPCCHQGKTPPCSRAVIAAGIRRVVVAQRDPFPQVDGGGLAELEAAGIETDVGVLQDEARRLNGPYLKLLETGRPWVIAKWAMTLDGKTASRTGSSQWISGGKSREVVHVLRGRVDAIVVGRETARCDDPSLTVRPPGPRTPLRVVVDTRAALDPQSQLVRTAGEVPVLVAAGAEAPETHRRRLTDAGCEVFVCPGESHADRLVALLDELGRRRLTNVLVEGGGRLVGSLLDGGQIDEVHVFIAPKLVGGAEATTPVAGVGLETIAQSLTLDAPKIQQIGPDMYIQGRVVRPV